MANKTIYFSDEALWNEAKSLAGKKGLSSVIQRAVEEFVSRSKASEDGFQPHRIDVGFAFDADTGKVGFSECLSFDGRLLLRLSSHMVAHEDPYTQPALSQGDGLPPGTPYDVLLTVYLTKGRKLIFILDETGGHGGPSYYSVHGSLKSLREDPHVKRLPPLERADFPRGLAKQLGEDWAVWID